MAHRELKQTWTLANEQFLQQQQMLQSELERMRKELTPAQLEHLSRDIRRERAKPAKAIKTVAEQPYQVKGSMSPEDLMKFDYGSHTTFQSKPKNSPTASRSEKSATMLSEGSQNVSSLQTPPRSDLSMVSTSSIHGFT